MTHSLTKSQESCWEPAGRENAEASADAGQNRAGLLRLSRGTQCFIALSCGSSRALLPSEIK